MDIYSKKPITTFLDILPASINEWCPYKINNPYHFKLDQADKSLDK